MHSIILRYPALVFLTGAPGVGKTTVGNRLSELIGLPFLDMGEEIRTALKNGDLPELDRELMEGGKICRKETLEQLINQVMSELFASQKAQGLIVVGIPRELAQLEFVQKITPPGVSDAKRVVLELVASRQVSTGRIKKRSEAAKKRGSGSRQDDAKILERFAEFDSKTQPALSALKEMMGPDYIKVDVEDTIPENVASCLMHLTARGVI